MTEYNMLSCSKLRGKIGLNGVNKEERTNRMFNKLRQIATTSFSNIELCDKLKTIKSSWDDVIDQYKRSVLHLVALNGNTRLVVGLTNSGACINARDGLVKLHLHLQSTRYIIIPQEYLLITVPQCKMNYL